MLASDPIRVGVPRVAYIKALPPYLELLSLFFPFLLIHSLGNISDYIH
jgi:hypothetical protein